MPCVDRTPSKGGKALWSIFRYGVGTEPESESAAAFHSVSLAFSIVCLFVLSTYTNTEKEYILSVSTFRTVVELYDIKTFDVKIKNSIKYFGHQIFSFEFPILEYKDNNEYIYFCAFSHYKNYWSNGLEYGEEKGFYVFRIPAACGSRFWNAEVKVCQRKI